MNIRRSQYSLWHSRDYCDENFRPVLAYLRQHPELFQSSNQLSNARGKEVWRLQFTDDQNCQHDLVYKVCHGKKPWRYLLDFSLPVREANHYLQLEAMHIPCGRVRCCGDQRCCFVLQQSYIITDFIAGTSDGTTLMPGGKEFHNNAAREQFAKLNCELLARVHAQHFYHKANHPRNVLYRTRVDGTMEIFWIDVARCRTIHSHATKAMYYPILHDLYTFFKDMCFDAESGERILKHYVAHFPECPFTVAALLGELGHFKRRAGSRPVNVFAQK